jgi:hypothetical protein
MAIDFNAMAATATRLLTENGIPMAFRRRGAQVYDPTTGKAVDAGSQDLPTVGAFQRRSRFYQVTGRGVGGVQRVDNVLMQERTVIVGPAVEPQLNDLLVVNGEEFQILDIEVKNPAGVPIAYLLTVRR